MKLSKIIKRFRIDHPHKFRLADIDPGDTCGLDIDKVEAKAIIAKSIATGYKVVARLNRARKRAPPLIIIPTALSVPSCSKKMRHPA